ncbi:hypothetical protein J6590_107198 [Homalodisca vitripennis]|nr:hypothetical protein J6590_107198 [Homalodisca vitripennis]
MRVRTTLNRLELSSSLEISREITTSELMPPNTTQNKTKPHTPIIQIITTPKLKNSSSRGTADRNENGTIKLRIANIKSFNLTHLTELYDIGFTFKSREETVKVTDFRSLFSYSTGTVLTQRD